MKARNEASLVSTFPRPEPGTHPPNDSPGYRSTALRHPKEPLIVIPHTLSELTGPVYPYGRMDVADSDLTRQHAAEPLGERVIVEGRVLDEDGRPLRQTLVEIWQANAAGRYTHRIDQHAAPLDPISPAPAARSPTTRAATASSRSGRARTRGRTTTTPGAPRTSTSRCSEPIS